jgi:DNA primase
MARIKDTSVEEVRRRAEIVDVVSLRTSLRKVGGDRFSGRCPFHDEKTPSFSVSAGKGFYHCFGCGKGGDVVTFIRESEGLDFAGAIEWLADRYRVPLEYEETSPEDARRRQTRERLYALLEQATSFFERHLWDSPGAASVREYVAGRGISEETARAFRLGLSPGRGLVAKAREKGFTVDELKTTGLANHRGNDYFPYRLMFPLADARGRIVGFQARKLHDDDPLQGKYVNTREGDLFKKGNVLYGLHLARPEIAKQDRGLVVEGNMDVIALHQAGVRTAVASMGTSLTEAQLRELARLTKRLYLCFDADAAGEDATLRGMELAVAEGFEVRVVTLPKGQDPADAPEGFEERLSSAESYVHYRVRLEIERATDKNEAYVRAREVLSRVPDTPDRQEALRLLADRLDLPREMLQGIAPASRSGGPAAIASRAEPPRVLAAGERLERDVLAACLAYPALREVLATVSPEHFESPLHRRFRERILAGAESRPDDDAELIALHAELDARAERDAIDERTGRERLLRLGERRLKRELLAAGSDLARTTELQARLAKIRQRLTDLQ